MDVTAANDFATYATSSAATGAGSARKINKASSAVTEKPKAVVQAKVEETNKPPNVPVVSLPKRSQILKASSATAQVLNTSPSSSTPIVDGDPIEDLMADIYADMGICSSLASCRDADLV